MLTPDLADEIETPFAIPISSGTGFSFAQFSWKGTSLWRKRFLEAVSFFGAAKDTSSAD